MAMFVAVNTAVLASFLRDPYPWKAVPGFPEADEAAVIDRERCPSAT